MLLANFFISLCFYNELYYLVNFEKYVEIKIYKNNFHYYIFNKNIIWTLINY
jgi:hypothetical protein